MTNEQKLFNAAIRESNLPDGAMGVADLAEIRVMGCIGQGVPDDSKEEFIKYGLQYLDTIGEVVEQALYDEEQNGEPSKDLIAAIKQYLVYAKQVDRDVYIKMLGEDWDERHK